MAAYKNIALAGASGSLGSVVLQALLKANFNVTILTRPDSSTSFPTNVKVFKVDYTNLSSLTSALQNQDAVISTIGFTGMLDEQKLLVDAAIAAGIERMIPSEYGSDPEDPRTRNLPVFGYKVQVEKHLKQAITGTETTYSLICNNEFFDWDLDNNFGVNIKNRKMEIFDGGDNFYSAAPLSFVAKGIVSVLQHSEETKDRVVRLHGMSMSQKKLLAIIQRFTGKQGWQIEHVGIAEREALGYELLQEDPANLYAWAMPFLHCAVYGQEFRNDFSNDNDNELLGLQALSDGEIEEIVKSRCG